MDLSLLGLAPFRRLLASRAVSFLGTTLAPIALAFAILEQPGGSATQLGALLAARVAATVAVLLVGGVYADRLPRAPLMVGADVVAGIAQAAFAVLILRGSPPFAALLALVMVQGAAAAVLLPAAKGLLPQLVDVRQLQSANALLRLSTNVAIIAGAGLAGVLVAVVGGGWALMVDAATFLVSAALLAGIPALGASRAEPSTLLADLRAGWLEFVARQWVWVVVAQFAIVNAATGARSVLGPVVAEQDLGGAAAWGFIVAAQGAGFVAGSVLALRLRPRYPIRAGVLVTFGFSPVLVLLALTAPVWAIAAAMLVNGLCSEVFEVLWDTTLQSHVPDEALSRVTSYDALGSFVLGPLGLVIAGPMSEQVGLTATLLGAAALCVVASAAALVSPDVRHLQRAPAA